MKTAEIILGIVSGMIIYLCIKTTTIEASLQHQEKELKHYADSVSQLPDTNNLMYYMSKKIKEGNE